MKSVENLKTVRKYINHCRNVKICFQSLNNAKKIYYVHRQQQELQELQKRHREELEAFRQFAVNSTQFAGSNPMLVPVTIGK